MPPFVAPLLALLAAMFAQEANGAVTDLLCENPNDWNPEAPFRLDEGMTTCSGVVGQFLVPFADKTVLGEGDCASVVNPDDGMTLERGLWYLSASCCGSGKPAFPCGWPWDSNPCETPFDFLMDAALGGPHCMGDEEVTDKETCINAGGEEAWDETAEEKCDVGRIDSDESTKEQACKQLRGTWEPSTCMDAMPHADEIFGSSTCDAKVDWPVLGAQKKTSMAWMASYCCAKTTTNDCGIMDMSPCSNAGDFNASAMISDSKCIDIVNLVSMLSNSVNFCELTQDECSSKHPSLGDQTFAVILQWAGMSCCGGQAPTAACSTTGCGITTGNGDDGQEEKDEGDVYKCAEVKEAYRMSECCGMPANPFKREHLPEKRRLSRRNNEEDIVEKVRAELARLSLTSGGMAELTKLSSRIEALLPKEIPV